MSQRSMSAEEQFLSMGDDAPPETIGDGIGLNGQGRMPSLDEIMAMIDSTGSIPEEEKASLKEDILRYHREQAGLDGYFSEAAQDASFFSPQVLLFLALVTLVALIIGFFAYKLIKTEKEKIRAKEVKKQAKVERKNKGKKA